MKRHIGPLLILAAGLSALPALAESAVERCEARPAILSLANSILDGREGMHRLRANKFGVDAAYLLIHYGAMEDAEITALLDRITDERLMGAEQLRAAYEIANGGDIQAITTFDPDIPDQGWTFESIRTSGWRSLILRDGGIRFFELAQNPDSYLFRHSLLPREDMIAFHALRALAGVPDATRTKIAQTAERMDQIPTALMLLAGNADPAPFHALIARHPDHRFLREKYIIDAVSAHDHAAPLAFDGAKKPTPFDFRRRFHEVRRADYRIGSFAFLGTFMNMTGKEFLVPDTAEAVNDAIDAGWLDPVKRPEQAWISVYRQLVERMGHAAVDAGLTFAREQRGYIDGQTVRDTIHGAIAARALRDYILGGGNAPPARPTLLPPETNFDWNAWVTVAKILRKGRTPTAPETSIAIELAVAADRIDTAIALIDTLPQVTALAAYRDVMKRLDLTCAAHTWRHGTSFDMPIYRFPTP